MQRGSTSEWVAEQTGTNLLGELNQMNCALEKSPSLQNSQYTSNTCTVTTLIHPNINMNLTEVHFKSA